MLVILARGDEEQFVGLMGKQEGIHEIGVLGDDDPVFQQRERIDRVIRSAVGQRQVERVKRIVTQRSEAQRQAARQLGIDQKFHAVMA